MRLLIGKTILFIILVLVAGAVPLLTADYASPWAGEEEQQPPCDFLTGGGWIITQYGSRANFGVAGGCKHGSPTWGHLNYLDHGFNPGGVVPPPFHVHWTSIEAYVHVETRGEPNDPKRKGTREICGTARTNNPLHPTVHFRVRVTDNGEPGRDDTFWMHLSDHPATPHAHEVFYDTGNQLLRGGNIQLHKPNPSTTGSFNECPYP